MNISEALRLGNGKITKMCFLNCYIEGGQKKHAFVDGKDFLVWNTGQHVSFSEIEKKDWLPYVPHVPRETLMTLKICDTITAYKIAWHKLKERGISNDVINKILIKPVPEKWIKRKEKFDNVEIRRFPVADLVTELYVPNFTEQDDLYRFRSLYKIRPMTMTLEWEE